MQIKTTQISAFMSYFNGISTMINNANLEFNKDSGITIKEIDKTGRVFIYAKFDKDCFETWNVDSNLTIGVDIAKFCACLKKGQNYDYITLDFDSNSIKVIFDSHHNKLKKTYTLKVLNIPNNSAGITPIDFTYKVTLKSSDFYDYCKDISRYSDKLRIRIIPNEMTLSSGDDSIEVVRKTGTKFSIECNDDKPLDISYDLPLLLLFTNCSNLSENVDIFIKDGYPIILCYKLASLGELKMVLNR